MNVPTANQKRLVIVGATGMVGGYAIRYALEHPCVKFATAIARRKLDLSHPKLNQVVHQNFADCSALREAFSGQDTAIFCLGAYTGAVTDAELRTITVDYTVEFSRVLHTSSPGAAFSFLSGSGADPSGRSRMPFARYKGEAEKALLAAGFPRTYIRPDELGTIVFHNVRKPELNKIAMTFLFHRLVVIGRGVTERDKQTAAGQTALAETTS
jgi:uncharacterized protein YbjT (DUF2867 family)